MGTPQSTTVTSLVVTAVSDEATDHLGVLFSAPGGLDYLRARRKVPEPPLAALSFGLSSICNILEVD